ncbi:hypothetical protein OKW34_007084 [Paraburkholderia youngii]
MIQQAEAVDRARSWRQAGAARRRSGDGEDQHRPAWLCDDERSTDHENLVAQMNSPLVDNLEKVGAVLLGRSNSPTFALRWFTSNQVHGKTFNSRDRSRTPGGRCERYRPWACRVSRSRLIW